MIHAIDNRMKYLKVVFIYKLTNITQFASCFRLWDFLKLINKLPSLFYPMCSQSFSHHVPIYIDENLKKSGSK